jgi:hypothetical protein
MAWRSMIRLLEASRSTTGRRSRRRKQRTDTAPSAPMSTESLIESAPSDPVFWRFAQREGYGSVND